MPYHLANAGVDIILCNAPNLYMDFAYNKHSKEPGLYWGGWDNERNSFNLLPYDVYRSVHMSMMGTRWIGTKPLTRPTAKPKNA